MKKLLLISFLILGFSFTANSQIKYQGEVQIGYNFGVKDFDPDYANGPGLHDHQPDHGRSV